MKHYYFLLWILVTGFANVPANAQPSSFDQNLDFVAPSTGGKFVEWYGNAGRTYFLQVSDPASHLNKWNWAPVIEPGNDEEISYEVDSTADKAFFRLQYTDQTATDLEAADFDSDGLSNLEEITPDDAGIQTNPLDSDTDHDGLSDKWERDHDLDPTDDGSIEPNNGPEGDLDDDKFSNLAEQTGGTNPGDPHSYPPGTPLPGGAPLLVGEQISSHGYRWGYVGFQNPAKSYNKLTSHSVSTDLNNDGGAGDCTSTESIDEEGFRTYTSVGTLGSFHEGSWSITSNVSRTYTGTATDGSGDTYTEVQTLSEEYTVPAFTAKVESWLPPYQNRFKTNISTASIYLTPDTDPYPAQEYGITKLHYKWKVNAVPDQQINWLEVFTPYDGSAIIVEARTWKPGATDTESPVYEIDPTTRNARKSGSYSLLSVELINPDQNILNDLKVAKLIETWAILPSRKILPNNDSDNFRIRIKGGATLGNISVQVSTKDNPDSAYDDNSSQIDLHPEGGDSVSDTLILVSDNEDDDHPIDEIEDDEPNDRSHKIQLGGNFVIDSLKVGNGSWFNCGAKIPVQVVKTVEISMVILRNKALIDGGSPLVPVTTVLEHLRIIKERYAQVGVKIDMNTIEIQDPPADVDLVDGLTLSRPSGAPVSDEARSLIQGRGTLDTSDIHLFYVNQIIAAGVPGITFGYAFTARTMPVGEEPYSYNAFISTIHTNSSIPHGGIVAAHELGHLLRDAGHAPSIGDVPQTQLMIDGATIDGILSGKRLSSDDQTKIRSNSHAH